MLHTTDSLRIEAADGTATLWLGFPGRLPNRPDAARLHALEPALDAVLANPFLERLVVRSAHPLGFSAGTPPATLLGLESDADRREFAAAGQRVLSKLADAPLVSVAFVEGPCLGSGLELALACDHRLAVAGPDSAFGFGDQPPCWGGPTRLRRLLGRRADELSAGRTLTAKEALRIGLVDDAFSARRAKIELQTFLNGLRPRKWRARWFAPPLGVGLAAERSAFARTLDRARLELEVVAGRVEPVALPPVVGLVGSDARVAELAGELAVRGVRVVVAPGETPLPDPFAEMLTRGRVTPLEREQAAGRVQVNAADRWAGFAAVEWVIVLDPDTNLLHAEAHAGRRAVIALARGLSEQPLADRPGRVVSVGFTANGTVEVGRGSDTDVSACEVTAGWLRRLGFAPLVLTARAVPVGERVRAAVWDEAVRLVAEGVPIRAVDALGVCPAPLAAMDKLGLTTAAERVPALRPLLAAGLTGRPDGFYQHPPDGPPVPNVFAQLTLWEGGQRPSGVSGTEYRVPSTEQAADRLAYRTVNAAAGCLADERYAGPAEIDAAAGLGGPVLASAGGPLRWADGRGLKDVARAMRKLGGRFVPHPELARRAAGGEGFYQAGDEGRARRVA